MPAVTSYTVDSLVKKNRIYTLYRGVTDDAQFNLETDQFHNLFDFHKYGLILSQNSNLSKRIWSFIQT